MLHGGLRVCHSAQESFSNFPGSNARSMALYFHRETEFSASSFRHLSNGRRLALGSAISVPQRGEKPCSGPAGPRGSPDLPRIFQPMRAHVLPLSVDLYMHSRRKSKSACRLLPSQRKLHSNPTEQPLSPRSMQSAANRRRDSTFSRVISLPNSTAHAPEIETSGCPRTPVTASVRPPRAARQPPPQLPGIVLGRTVLVPQVRQTTAPRCKER